MSVFMYLSLFQTNRGFPERAALSGWPACLFLENLRNVILHSIFNLIHTRFHKIIGKNNDFYLKRPFHFSFHPETFNGLKASLDNSTLKRWSVVVIKFLTASKGIMIVFLNEQNDHKTVLWLKTFHCTESGPYCATQCVTYCSNSKPPKCIIAVKLCSFALMRPEFILNDASANAIWTSYFYPFGCYFLILSFKKYVCRTNKWIE